MATQFLYRPACSLCHIAFQLIALLQYLSDVLQDAYVTPRLKKSMLPPCELSSYRLLKLLKRVNRPTGNVATDLTEAIDVGDHALLGLLDLSATFDTVDQNLVGFWIKSVIFLHL